MAATHASGKNSQKSKSAASKTKTNKVTKPQPAKKASSAPKRKQAANKASKDRPANRPSAGSKKTKTEQEICDRIAQIPVEENSRPPSTEPVDESEFNKSYQKMERVRRRGPDGPVVRDALGYQLDYHKVVGGMRVPSRSAAAMDKRLKQLNERMALEERKREIMATPKEEEGGLASFAWDERVSRDLKIPYHRVELEHFEKWKNDGFRAKPREFDDSFISKEKRRLLFKLAEGCVFRK
ncbi:MAG: hypothetical protein Q9167_007060 [Letrouitia subvulpina]